MSEVVHMNTDEEIAILHVPVPPGTELEELHISFSKLIDFGRSESPIQWTPGGRTINLPADLLEPVITAEVRETREGDAVCEELLGGPSNYNYAAAVAGRRRAEPQ